MCVQNLKFVALPVPGTIGATQKIGQSLNTPTLLFLKNFVGMDLRIFRPNLNSVALPVPEIIATGLLGGGC